MGGGGRGEGEGGRRGKGRGSWARGEGGGGSGEGEAEKDRGGEVKSPDFLSRVCGAGLSLLLTMKRIHPSRSTQQLAPCLPTLACQGGKKAVCQGGGAVKPLQYSSCGMMLTKACLSHNKPILVTLGRGGGHNSSARQLPHRLYHTSVSLAHTGCHPTLANMVGEHSRMWSNACCYVA